MEIVSGMPLLRNKNLDEWLQNTSAKNPNQCVLTGNCVMIENRKDISAGQKFQALFGCGKASISNVLWKLTDGGVMAPRVDLGNNEARLLTKNELGNLIKKIENFQKDHFFLGKSKKLNTVLDTLKKALNATAISEKSKTEFKKSSDKNIKEQTKTQTTGLKDQRQTSGERTGEQKKTQTTEPEVQQQTSEKNIKEQEKTQAIGTKVPQETAELLIKKATQSKTDFQIALSELAKKDNKTILLAIEQMKKNKISVGQTDYSGHTLASRLIQNCENDPAEIKVRLPLIAQLIIEMEPEELLQKAGTFNILNLLLSEENSNWILEQDNIINTIINKMPFDGLRGLTRQLKSLMFNKGENEALDDKIKKFQASIIQRQSILFAQVDPDKLKPMQNNEDLIKALNCIEVCKDPTLKQKFVALVIEAIQNRNDLTRSKFDTDDGYFMHLAVQTGSPKVVKAVLEKQNLLDQIDDIGGTFPWGTPLHVAIYSQANANDKLEICKMLINKSTLEQLKIKSLKGNKLTPLQALEQEMKNEKNLISSLRVKLGIEKK